MDYEKSWNEIKRQLDDAFVYCEQKHNFERAECYGFILKIMKTMELLSQKTEEQDNELQSTENET